jgi:transposase InsO family protein
MTDPIADARREYELQLHAALLRTMRAVLDLQPVPSPARAPLEAELAGVVRDLAALPDDDARRPMHALARRQSWSADEVGFVWTAIALAVNPRMLVHARALDDTSTRGLSASLYARIAALEPTAARAHGLAFGPGRGASRAGLQSRARSTSPTATDPRKVQRSAESESASACSPPSDGWVASDPSLPTTLSLT